MIADILRRSYLVDWVDALISDLTLVGSADEASRAALECLQAAANDDVPGQLDDAYGETSRRSRGFDKASSFDEQAFFSRNPIVSLVQSAVEEMLKERYADEIVDDSVSNDRRADGAEIPAITSRRLDFDVGDGRRLFGAFQPRDIRWVTEFVVSKAVRGDTGKHPFNPEPAPSVELAENARLVIVGDWGSGLVRAQSVARQMCWAIDRGLELGRQVHAVHLGDVYYSGFSHEVRERFLEHWPVELDDAGQIFSWALNGNHDMYSGGHGYFQELLGDPRFAQQAQSSWFRLENEHWRIIGLDTAWDEKALVHDPRTTRGLQDPQATRLQEWAAEDNRPFMLLSHHQLFSCYEDVGPILQDKLAPVLAAQRIRAWFWGHEHKCIAYEPHDDVAYARCVGHGGVPVYPAGEPDRSGPAVRWREDRSFEGWLEDWALFGFAVVDIDGPDVRVTYVDENGDEAHEETFSAA